MLSDAAKRLDVSAVRAARRAVGGQDAQLDADVKAGRLTQEQAASATATSRRARRTRHLRRHAPCAWGGSTGGPDTGPADVFDAAADALGISQEKLFEQLRDGKSLAEIAKANGKSMDDVKAAVRKAVKAELDEAVENGPLVCSTTWSTAWTSAASGRARGPARRPLTARLRAARRTAHVRVGRCCARSRTRSSPAG